ncbi:cysteine-rich CWC family protein [Rheinheimera sp.]|uniref:cysteine-rich CWC family protein n=1 Tax=Rheinheimera sp. TaxID=1869214 RepID=UPI002FDEFD93
MSVCPGCGKENLCAVSAGEPAESCWCLRLPFGLAEQAGLPATALCYCQSCLTTLAAKLVTEASTEQKTATGQKPG